MSCPLPVPVLLLILSMLLALAVPSVAEPIALYVAPNGNDAWSGTRPDAAANDGPFATLVRARDALRKLRAEGKLTEGAIVFVRGGAYELAETLALGPEDSGSPDAPVVYRAYRDEKPVLLGARKVTGFRPYKGPIMQCDLKGTPLEKIAFRQLFFRGERMTMARYPNVDPKDPHFGTWAYVLSVDGPSVKDHFTCTDDVIKDWSKVDQAQVCIHPAYGWAWNIVPIKSVDRDAKTITLAANVSYNLMVGDRYFVQNLLEELDAPGEWYLDRDASTLYFWPPADLASGEVLAPVLPTLVAMEGASHVTVRGFTLEACEADAVMVQDCESCRIAQSTIRNCGAWGVVVSGGHRSGAVGNDMYARYDPGTPDVPQREQDLEQAKALLAEAGYADLTVELVTSAGALGADEVAAAQVFAEQAKGAGVTVKVKKVDSGVFYGEDYLTWPFAQDFWFTRNYLAQAGQCSMPGAPYNETHWENAEWLAIVQEALRTVDDAQRNELVGQAMTIEYNEGGYIIWAFRNQVDAYSSDKIAGLKLDKLGAALGQFNFKDVYFV